MANKRKIPGRPQKPEGEARGKVVTVRLTDTERKSLWDAANREAEKLSDWMRRVLLSAAQRSPVPVMDRTSLEFYALLVAPNPSGADVPVQFTVHPDARLVVYIVEGRATPEEAREFLDAVASHPDFQRGLNFLGDRRDVVRGPSSGYVYGVSDEVNVRKAQFAPCKWAVIVSNDYAYWMARMWGMMTEKSGVEIVPFREAEEATEWLGVDAYHVPTRFIPSSNNVVLVGV
jgi:hypothetical protein